MGEKNTLARLIIAISLLVLVLAILVTTVLALLWSSDYISNNALKKLKEYNQTNTGKKTINTINYFEKQIEHGNKWVKLIAWFLFASLFLTSLVAIILLVVETRECPRRCG